MFCPQCGLKQPTAHHYCVSCGARLPRELLRHAGPKVSRWFWTIPIAPEDPPHAALRVSRYLDEIEITTPDGSVKVPSNHVRISVWIDDRAVCAISIPDDEAERLADFLLAWAPEQSGGEGSKPGEPTAAT
jgi:hypothetical protein